MHYNNYFNLLAHESPKFREGCRRLGESPQGENDGDDVGMGNRSLAPCLPSLPQLEKQSRKKGELPNDWQFWVKLMRYILICKHHFVKGANFWVICSSLSLCLVPPGCRKKTQFPNHPCKNQFLINHTFKWFLSPFQLFRLPAVADGPAWRRRWWRRGQAQPELGQLVAGSGRAGPPNE